MTVEFKLPDIGEGVAEGEITRWIVKEGDPIKEDQPMVEVMTDKATVEITSPVTGTVQKILFQEGSVVPVHETIVVLAESAGSSPAASSAAPAAKAQKPAPSPAAPAASAAAPSKEAPPVTAAPGGNGKVLAAPATRKLARDMGVDLAAVSGTGPRGRVTSEDVRGTKTEPSVARTGAPKAPATSAPKAPAFPIRSFTPGGEDRTAYRGIRKAIGDQMVKSAFTAPHFTYVDEVDMTELYALRKKAAGLAEEQGVKLTFLPFIIKALSAAIRRHPIVNSLLDEEKGEIVTKHDIHVGIATDTDRGLLVPVIRHAHEKSVLEVAADLQRLSHEARSGTIQRDDLVGSTITITSAGSIGGLFATPIINYPEVAILGVYQIKDKPVIRDGNVVPGKIGYLSLTLDHRVVDGATAAHFVNHMKRLLEGPGLMVLGG